MTVNPYPVDSATRTCCGGIGAHTEQCPELELPVPDGATADDWAFEFEGVLTRSLTWTKHDAGGVGVAVDGWQTTSGEVTRSVSLYDTNKELTAADARALAAALVEAADELEDKAGRSTHFKSIDRKPLSCCHTCGDGGTVRMSTGKWTYTAPCPDCRTVDFVAAQIDGDHFIMGPAS